MKEQFQMLLLSRANFSSPREKPSKAFRTMTNQNGLLDRHKDSMAVKMPTLIKVRTNLTSKEST